MGLFDFLKHKDKAAEAAPQVTLDPGNAAPQTDGTLTPPVTTEATVSPTADVAQGAPLVSGPVKDVADTALSAVQQTGGVAVDTAGQDGSVAVPVDNATAGVPVAPSAPSVSQDNLGGQGQ